MATICQLLVGEKYKANTSIQALFAGLSQSTLRRKYCGELEWARKLLPAPINDMAWIEERKTTTVTETRVTAFLAKNLTV